MVWRRLAWMAGTLAAGLVGCNNNQPSVDTSGGAYREVATPSAELIAVARPRLPDVPVPVGFDLDEDRSRDFSSGGARWADHVYRGSADKEAAARFYTRQMPIARWVLTSQTRTQGEIFLDFDKDPDRCRITIGKGNWFRPTVIMVQVWTSGRIETKDKGTSPR